MQFWVLLLAHRASEFTTANVAAAASAFCSEVPLPVQALFYTASEAPSASGSYQLPTLQKDACAEGTASQFSLIFTCTACAVL